MSEKILKSRVVQKHDIEANWLKAVNFVPLQSELIVYDIEIDTDGNTLALPSGRTEPYTYQRFKIGDGITRVSDLPFAIVKQTGEGNCSNQTGAESTEAIGDYSLAHGYDKIILDTEGNEISIATKAIGIASVAMGKGNTTYGNYSSGFGCLASTGLTEEELNSVDENGLLTFKHNVHNLTIATANRPSAVPPDT